MAELNPQSDPPRDLSAGHTPTPWRFLPYRTRVTEAILLHGNDEIGLLYASDGLDEPTPFPACPNAAFIVKAVNAHDELVKALRDLRLTARVLLQNAEGCAVNHYGNDFELHGEPGWLRDSRRIIEAAEAALSKLSEGLPTPEARDAVSRPQEPSEAP